MKIPPSALLLLWVLNVQAIRNSNRQKENRALQVPEVRKAKKPNDGSLSEEDCQHASNVKGKNNDNVAGCELMPSIVPTPSTVPMPSTGAPATSAPGLSPLDTIPPSDIEVPPTPSPPSEAGLFPLDTIPPSDLEVTPTPSPPSEPQEPTGAQSADETVETQGSIEQDGGLVSSCKEEPPSDGPSRVTTTVKYEYVALVTKGADVQAILAAVEEGTHMAYTSELLICNFTRRMLKENYGYTKAYSAPLDQANQNKACVNPPDPTAQDCHIVNGGATFEHLSGNPDSALVESQVGAILTDTYDGGGLVGVHKDLVRLNFVSIIEETTNGTDTTGDNDPAGGETIGAVPGDGAGMSASASTIGGSVAVAIAAAGLVLVGFVLVRRHGSRVIHTEKLDDKDTLAEDGELSTGSLSYESPKALVLNDELDDELDDEDSYMHLERSIAYFDQDMTLDPEWNMTLPPVFVATNFDLTRSYKELGHETFSHSQRAYVIPDTVEL